ncbi:hypothetical protein ACFY93_28710 [Streptomyces sp. NPDC008313]|uniref:hypothetical protein n=1 Tax=Streptomyces sp. NPDC008313 TaxID=3364826 RepID=UPI0036EB00ED
MGRIRTGRPDVRPDTPAHVDGIRQGNALTDTPQPGHHADGTADARRSTGVDWRKHDAILKIMPNISPA